MIPRRFDFLPQKGQQLIDSTAENLGIMQIREV
jgi:hypothetical protein